MQLSYTEQHSQHRFIFTCRHKRTYIIRHIRKTPKHAYLVFYPKSHHWKWPSSIDSIHRRSYTTHTLFGCDWIFHYITWIILLSIPVEIVRCSLLSASAGWIAIYNAIFSNEWKAKHRTKQQRKKKTKYMAMRVYECNQKHAHTHAETSRYKEMFGLCGSVILISISSGQCIA